MAASPSQQRRKTGNLWIALALVAVVVVAGLAYFGREGSRGGGSMGGQITDYSSPDGGRTAQSPPVGDRARPSGG